MNDLSTDLPTSSLSTSEAADWLATKLWERVEHAGKEVVLMYHIGALAISPGMPTVSIGLTTDSGSVYLIEDALSRFWISCSSSSCTSLPAVCMASGDERRSWLERGLERGLEVLTGKPSIARCVSR